ncbi:hypothetical protein Celaphus_00011210, partial [Cervus elaphus hippelaphus]
VSRMLPGGLLVLGVFIITALEMGNEFQNTLRRLVFAVEKSVNKKRLWNFTEEEVSERSSAKPADWKYQNGLSASWLSLECTVYVNIHVPLSTTSVSYTLEKNTKNGLARWAKQIEDGIYLINGQVKDEDSDLLEGQLLNSDHRSTAMVQICSGSVNLKDSEKEFHILPHRVFVPIPGSTVMLCDYKFGDESAEEIRDHFIEMLDRMIQIEDLEIAEEINTET